MAVMENREGERPGKKGTGKDGEEWEPLSQEGEKEESQKEGEALRSIG